MTAGGILAAIAGIGAVATAITVIIHIFLKSSAQQGAEIDRQMAKDRDEAEKTGRPV